MEPKHQYLPPGAPWNSEGMSLFWRWAVRECQWQCRVVEMSTREEKKIRPNLWWMCWGDVIFCAAPHLVTLFLYPRCLPADFLCQCLLFTVEFHPEIYPNIFCWPHFSLQMKKGHFDWSACCFCLALQVGSHRVKLSRGFEANAPAFER